MLGVNGPSQACPWSVATFFGIVLAQIDQVFISFLDRNNQGHLRNFSKRSVNKCLCTFQGGDPSSLSILNSGSNGNRFASDDDNQCTTCAEFKAEKKCGACKMVSDVMNRMVSQ